MTMFSTEDPRQFYGGYGGGFGNYMSYDQAYTGSDLVICGGDSMAEDESRTGSLNESTREEERDEGWLQLSIGGGSSREANPQRDGSGLVELELLPSSRPLGLIPDNRPPRSVANFSSTVTTSTGFSPSFFLHQGPGNSSNTNFQQRQGINWGFPTNITTPPSSSSSSTYFSSPSTLMASASYFSRPPFQIYPAPTMGPRPGPDFRVIPPPRRPHSGIWFMLQASKNQEKEPYLPQISKSYLRIKDGRMTIRLVLKYLVNKLSLDNESEIEIRCKGERLQALWTLQHVRDNIWMNTNRDTYFTLLPNSSTLDHIMVLHYATPN